MKIIKSIPSENVYFHVSEIEGENCDASAETAVVNVFDEIAYQSVVGFDAAFTESAGYNYSLMTSEQKEEFLKCYFDRNDGIGYNFGRTHINSCDFSLDIYSYVEDGDKDLKTFSIERDKKYIIPMIKDALKYCQDELFLFASPWSPPAYMKKNESVIGGGQLKEEYKKTWAKYYVKYIEAYKAEGIDIAGITIQNEPKAKQTWESCYYTEKDEKEFLAEYLIPELDKAGLSDIKIIIWDHNKERVYDRAKYILEDDAISKRVWAVGHHWYTGDHFDGLKLVYENLHKPVICTEFCSGINVDVITLAERYGKEMCGNFNNYEIASCDWNILLSENGGPYHNRTAKSESRKGMIYESKDGGCYAPVLYDSTKKKIIYTPIYYYIGHMSKYVLRGAKRIATTKYTDNISVCGFKNPDGSIVLVMYNLSDYSLPVVMRHKGVCTKIEMEAHSAMTVLI